MKKSRSKTLAKPENIRAEIRTEIRGILRQFEDLRCPIERFERLPDPSKGQPEYYVHFDDRRRLRIKGLRFKSNSVSLPDERITDAVLSLASVLSVSNFRIQ